MKLFIVALLTLAHSTLSSTALCRDSIREEVREMTLKNHLPLSSYRASRHEIMQNLHLDSDQEGYYVQDVYCQYKFRGNVGPNRMPNHSRINVEHTWPKSRFNPDESYKTQESDLHHLYPSESKTNGRRGNHLFAEFASGDPVRDCPTSEMGTIPGANAPGFEPPKIHKGNVARSLFYFSIRYNINIPDIEEKVLRFWNQIDPVDEDERERNNEIQRLQGNLNPFINDPTLAELIENF